jgi:hypothetical protein
LFKLQYIIDGMKSKFFQNTATIPLVVGLLLIALSQIMGRYIILPDFAKGALMGIGIGLEIIALIKVRSEGETSKGPTENQ